MSLFLQKYIVLGLTLYCLSQKKSPSDCASTSSRQVRQRKEEGSRLYIKLQNGNSEFGDWTGRVCSNIRALATLAVRLSLGGKGGCGRTLGVFLVIRSSIVRIRPCDTFVALYY